MWDYRGVLGVYVGGAGSGVGIITTPPAFRSTPGNMPLLSPSNSPVTLVRWRFRSDWSGGGNVYIC
jgi:hypothetical protein